MESAVQLAIYDVQRKVVVDNRRGKYQKIFLETTNRLLLDTGVVKEKQSWDNLKL